MNESKIGLTERLRAEGRWSEASNFREAARAEFRAKGMGRQEAADAAWEAMAEAYPALPVAEATVAPIGNDNGRVRGLSDIPADWPALPDNALLPAELGWIPGAIVGCVGLARHGDPQSREVGRPVREGDGTAGAGERHGAA
jgi:hypothetical protein